jgi:hypothetical protein
MTVLLSALAATVLLVGFFWLIMVQDCNCTRQPLGFVN